MQNYIQKKLAISEEILIPGLIDKNKLNPDFNINDLKNNLSSNISICRNSDRDLTKKSNRSLHLILFSEVRKNDIDISLNCGFEKLANGGYLLINIEYLNFHKIELEGIMMYYGFEIKTEIFSNNKKYIFAKKRYEKSNIKKPALNFLISLDRVGMGGKNIKIHKFRSMYKYSEFLHQGVLEDEGISTMGKVKSDPRITPLGKFMRKYWIDELPQIFDLLTFKIKLVGIRAMSYAFFEQYPERYKQKYFKVKPGLIGPIFDEKTTGFNEIVRIEEKYLDDYLNNPFKTDFKLFFKTLIMIFKGLRSS